MTHNLKTGTFSQKTGHSGGVILLPLIPLFSFVTFHLKKYNTPEVKFYLSKITSLIKYSTYRVMLFLSLLSLQYAQKPYSKLTFHHMEKQNL